MNNINKLNSIPQNFWIKGVSKQDELILSNKTPNQDSLNIKAGDSDPQITNITLFDEWKTTEVKNHILIQEKEQTKLNQDLFFNENYFGFKNDSENNDSNNLPNRK